MLPKDAKIWLARIRLTNWLTPIYLCIIFIALVAFGSVGPFALSSVTAGMAALAFATIMRRKISQDFVWVMVFGPICLLALLSWVFVQTLPAPMAANPIWNSLNSLGLDKTMSVSIQPADTFYTMQCLILPFLTFFTGLIIARDAREARTLVRAIGLVGAVVTTLSFGQFLLANDFILSHPKVFYRDSFTAFFINRNNAGTFVGLTLLVILRQFWSETRAFSIRDLCEFTLLGRTPSGRRPLSAIAYAGLLMVVIVALFMTKSRGAIVASTASSVALGLILLWLRLRERSRVSESATMSKMLLRSLVLLAAAAGVFMILGDRVVMRAQVLGADDPRFCVMPSITKLLSASWPWGTGAGTFADAFAAYRDPACGLSGIWQKAHNSYLQSLIELGVPGSALLLISGLVVISVLARKLFTDHPHRSYIALALAALMLVAAHSLVDFSMEIPAVATYLAALVSASISTSGTGPYSNSIKTTEPTSMRGLRTAASNSATSARD